MSKLNKENYLFLEVPTLKQRTIRIPLQILNRWWYASASTSNECRNWSTTISVTKIANWNKMATYKSTIFELHCADSLGFGFCVDWITICWSSDSIKLLLNESFEFLRFDLLSVSIFAFFKFSREKRVKISTWILEVNNRLTNQW